MSASGRGFFEHSTDKGRKFVNAKFSKLSSKISHNTKGAPEHLQFMWLIQTDIWTDMDLALAFYFHIKGFFFFLFFLRLSLLNKKHFLLSF